MKILAHIHGYPPHHNAGAEWMLHTILRNLVDRGHEATVLMPSDDIHDPHKNFEYLFEGVTVKSLAHHAKYEYPKCDIVITHLEKGSDALHGAPSYCAKYNKPLARLVHNERELFYFNATKVNTDLVVFNSNWIAESYNSSLTGDWHQIVFPPPVDSAYYASATKGSTDQQFVTLINLNDNKGGNQFYDIATELPDVQFMGVKGAYDKQLIRNLDNVTIHDHTSDIRSVYRKTKILLVPSAYETWGRVAIEAMAAGIPVIANAATGLKEACADAAIFCKRGDAKAWAAEIKKLLSDKKYYKKYSDAGRKRAKELEPDYAKIENAFMRTIDNKRHGSPKVVEKSDIPEWYMNVDLKFDMRVGGINYKKGKALIPTGQAEMLIATGRATPIQEP